MYIISYCDVIDLVHAPLPRRLRPILEYVAEVRAALPAEDLRSDEAGVGHDAQEVPAHCKIDKQYFYSKNGPIYSRKSKSTRNQ